MQKSKGLVHKVILDTSCCVAALLSKNGASAAVFTLILEGKIFNFYTEEIFKELQEVIARPKFNLEQEKQKQFLHLFQEASFQVQPLEEYQVKQCRDPNDDKFLALAQQIDADFLITIDEDLLVLKNIKKTKIILPGEFMRVIESVS